MDARADAVINWAGPMERATRYWLVERMQRRNGRIWPIRLTFGQPSSGAEVSAHIIRRQIEGHLEWTPYRFFDLHPGPRGGWQNVEVTHA